MRPDLPDLKAQGHIDTACRRRRAEARRRKNLGFQLAEQVRYNERTAGKRVNGRLKEEHVETPNFHLSACRASSQVGDPGQVRCSPAKFGTAPSRKPWSFAGGSGDKLVAGSVLTPQAARCVITSGDAPIPLVYSLQDPQHPGKPMVRVGHRVYDHIPHRFISHPTVPTGAHPQDPRLRADPPGVVAQWRRGLFEEVRNRAESLHAVNIPPAPEQAGRLGSMIWEGRSYPFRRS